MQIGEGTGFVWASSTTGLNYDHCLTQSKDWQIQYVEYSALKFYRQNWFTNQMANFNMHQVGLRGKGCTELKLIAIEGIMEFWSRECFKKHNQGQNTEIKFIASELFHCLTFKLVEAEDLNFLSPAIKWQTAMTGFTTMTGSKTNTNSLRSCRRTITIGYSKY